MNHPIIPITKSQWENSLQLIKNETEDALKTRYGEALIKALGLQKLKNIPSIAPEAVGLNIHFNYDGPVDPDSLTFRVVRGYTQTERAFLLIKINYDDTVSKTSGLGVEYVYRDPGTDEWIADDAFLKTMNNRYSNKLGTFSQDKNRWIVNMLDITKLINGGTVDVINYGSKPKNAALGKISLKMYCSTTY